jgi:SAM-dependent methyltransferase
MTDIPGSEVSERWVTWRRKVDLDGYDQRWEEMVQRGEPVHGEMDFIERFLKGSPANILDAGCGTGRLAIEATRRGHHCVGVDLDRDMVERARLKAPHIQWIHADLSKLDLGRTFDVAVMAGNIPLFCAPGTQSSIIRSLAQHLRPGGFLICGFSIEKRAGAYTASDFDRDAVAAGLQRCAWYSTWDADINPEIPAAGELDDYAVLVYQR